MARRGEQSIQERVLRKRRQAEPQQMAMRISPTISIPGLRHPLAQLFGGAAGVVLQSGGQPQQSRQQLGRRQKRTGSVLDLVVVIEVVEELELPWSCSRRVQLHEEHRQRRVAHRRLTPAWHRRSHNLIEAQKRCRCGCRSRPSAAPFAAASRCEHKIEDGRARSISPRSAGAVTPRGAPSECVFRDFVMK